MKVGVIDYGVGNLGSVLRALDELRVSPQLITQPAQASSMDKLILPGVGNFADCIEQLEKDGWVEELKSQVLGGGKSLLGVCVGMQLLATCSAEGSPSVDGEQHPGGLGFVPGRVEHLRQLGCGLRVPHVGWNSVRGIAEQEGLFAGIPEGTDFYFVHSYAYVPDDPADSIAVADYGTTFTAAVRRGNVWGTQFHPEKSSKAGLRLIKNFVDGASC
ncbi:imidazole glycerol phosphate synthase subunit HisH [Achromobacter xylosoxidans]|uniref:imidazole glycerol phosphate synthase subunit HisH n=1 Tax=Alcaligenes xylosoxydans xylosoxydans TaxID=85698 RepID=UPI0034D3FB37